MTGYWAHGSFQKSDNSWVQLRSIKAVEADGEFQMTDVAHESVRGRYVCALNFFLFSKVFRVPIGFGHWKVSANI